MLLLSSCDEIAQMAQFHLIPSRHWTDKNKILDLSVRIITDSRPAMKALVLNAVDRGFDFEDVEIASPEVATFLSTFKRQASVTRTSCSPRTRSCRHKPTVF